MLYLQSRELVAYASNQMCCPHVTCWLPFFVLLSHALLCVSKLSARTLKLFPLIHTQCVKFVMQTQTTKSIQANKSIHFMVNFEIHIYINIYKIQSRINTFFLSEVISKQELFLKLKMLSWINVFLRVHSVCIKKTLTVGACCVSVFLFFN